MNFEQEKMIVTLLTGNAITPRRMTQQSAGVDLYSAEDKVIKEHNITSVPTDVSIRFPEGTYGRIADRSGLASTHGVTTLGGVIDPDYVGNFQIIMCNLGTKPISIRKGHRIAQIVVERMAVPEIEVVDLTHRPRLRVRPLSQLLQENAPPMGFIDPNNIQENPLNLVTGDRTQIEGEESDIGEPENEEGPEIDVKPTSSARGERGFGSTGL